MLPLGCWGIGNGGVHDLSTPRDPDPPRGISSSGIDSPLIRAIEFLDVKDDPAEVSLGADGAGGWLGRLDCGGDVSLDWIGRSSTPFSWVVVQPRWGKPDCYDLPHGTPY